MPTGHLQHHVGALGAGAVAAHAVAAGGGLEMLLVAVVDERVEAVDAFGPDVAAAPAVAAVGAAELDELLAPEGDGAGAAVAGADDRPWPDREISCPHLPEPLARENSVDVLDLGIAGEA